MSATQFAIVGHSCRFPGGADSPAQFWNLLANGLEALTDIPKRCFDIDEVYEPPEQSRGRGKYRRMGVRSASLINDAESFDANFFGISRREAKVMDPQQRQLLQVAHEAVEVSGYCPSSPTPSTSAETFGVYVAAATDDYVANLSTQEVDVFYSPATLRAFLAGRISHHFGWEGPSLVLDTACSSSLVTLHTACRAIAAGDCRSALVAGVNIITSPAMFLGLYRGHFLSQDGRCKTFDASADGYGRAEGVAAFVVKSLDDALADGDHIEAVIRATALNQSGLAKSITHPDQATQVKLFKKVNEMAGIKPSDVSVVEMHGTGTKAGDRCEMKSLSTVYGAFADTPLYLGSVKANVGHSEAAAGFAGLTKLLGMLREQSIPPQISLKTLNPELAPLVANTRIEIPTRVQEWPFQVDAQGKPKEVVALLNSIGAAGSNATALIQQWRGEARLEYTEEHNKAREYVFCLSAKSSKGLVSLAGAYLDYIRANGDTDGRRLCYSSMARRIHYTSFRYAFATSGDLQVIRTKLEALLAREQADLPKKLAAKAIPVFVLLRDSHPPLSALHQHCSREPAFARAWSEVLGEVLGEDQAASGMVLLRDDVLPDDQTSLLLTFCFNVSIMRRWQAWGLRNITLLCPSERTQTVARVLSGSVTVKEGWQAYQDANDGKPGEHSRFVTLDGAAQALVPQGSIVLGQGAMVIASDTTREVDQVAALLADAAPDTVEVLASRLFQVGVSLDWRAMFEASAFAALAQLPLHPFERDIVWVDYQHMTRPGATATQDGGVDFRPIASPRRAYNMEASSEHAAEASVCHATTMDIASVREEIVGHLVAGKGMCPASVYHEMALSTAGMLRPLAGAMSLKGVSYIAPLAYNETQPGTMICQLMARGTGAYQARISSQSMPGGRLVPHFVGEVVLDGVLSGGLDGVLGLREEVKGRCTGPAVATRALYDAFAARVVQYSPLYQTIERFFASPSGLEGYAVLKAGCFPAHAPNQRPYALNPVLQDTMLHTAGYLANTGCKSSESVNFIATSLGNLTALAPREQPVEAVARMEWREHTSSLVCEVYAFSASGNVVAFLDNLVFKRVDKRAFSAALAGAGSQKSSTGARPTAATLPSLKATVVSIISDGAGVAEAEIAGSTALKEMGVDSLLFIEIVDQLNERFPALTGLQNEASTDSTVDEFVELCHAKMQAAGHEGGKQDVEQRRVAEDASSTAAAIRILAHILAVEDLDGLSHSDSSMGELGLDSLGAIEVAEGLARELGVSVCPDSLIACQTVKEYCALVHDEAEKSGVKRMHTTQAPAQGPTEHDATLPFYDTVTAAEIALLQKALKLTQNPVLIRRGASYHAAPLFLCADGSGIAATYLSLPREQVRDIWALHHERLIERPRRDWGVVEHASELVGALVSVYPAGPLIVAGWSFGGILAWEMTHQLQALGRQVLGTLAIDTPCPLGHSPLDETILDALIPLFSTTAGQEDWRLVRGRELIRASFLKSGNAIVGYSERTDDTALRAAMSTTKAVDMVLLRSTDDFRASVKQRSAMEAGGNKFDWLLARSHGGHGTLGWEKLGGVTMVLDIPGSHFTPFAKRNVGAVSAAMERACALFQAHAEQGARTMQ